MRCGAGGEISILELNKARAIDIRELPSIIRSDADAPFVYAFRYIERPYNISFTIRKHKGFKIDPAIADRIIYTRVISPKGKVLSQARIQIRNSRKQYAAFHLPEGAKIMSTFLDGKSVKPSIDEKKTLLLPLKRQSATPFILDVVFEEPDTTVKSFWGNVRFSYPRVDIPASIVQSDIYLPEKMKAFEPEGDFRKIQAIDFVPWSSRTDDSFKRAIRNIRKKSAQTRANIPQIRDSIPQTPGVTGAMSLKIKLPRHGRKISMNAFYVPALQSLETRIFMMHQNLYRIGFLLAALVFVLAG